MTVVVFYFFSLFSLEKKTMVSPLVMPKDAEDIGTYYVSDEQILFFQIEVNVLSYEGKGMVILEMCSPTKRVTMTISYGHPFTYFYLYPPFFPFGHGGLEGSQCCAFSVAP